MTNKHAQFRGNLDYKSEFRRAAYDIINSRITDRALRIEAIGKLIDEYVDSTGRVPDARIIETLTDAILHEELTDRHPDKITREEYPFMSERQIQRRQTTRPAVGIVEYGRAEVGGYVKTKHSTDSDGGKTFGTRRKIYVNT